jgi:hypothetical protein
MQNQFFEKYCDEFEDKNENKFSYMDIFKKYNEITESYIEKVFYISYFYLESN